MKVKDVMNADTDKSCTFETKLFNAAKLMKDTNRGALPIVDKDNKVVGIITERDVCLTLATKTEKISSELSVKDAVPKLIVHTVFMEDSVTKALEEMRKNKIGRLPVTDTEGKLKGVVSVNNLLSSTLGKKEGFGPISSNEKYLSKTIKTLFDRNNAQQVRKEFNEW